ncbi:MAG: hypothetical protein KJZ83_21360 [Burkholderiaceae bacterium]|nr:hypothetical protein [Burkholderiaceae bacterium]
MAGLSPRTPRLRRAGLATLAALAAASLAALQACASAPGAGAQPVETPAAQSAAQSGSRPVSQPAGRSATPPVASIAPGSGAGALAQFQVDVRDLDWTDAQRARVVPARLYLPAATGPVPLVVFSHGLGGSRFGYSHLGRYWAAHGIAALHLQHAGSDRAVWGARDLSTVAAVINAATFDNAIARVQDVSFAIDRVLADAELGRLIDPARIGVAGHSFGANTALLASGARFRRDDSVLSFTDRRVRAAVILSAPSLPAEQDPWFVYGPIAVPTLHLTGTHDYIALPVLGSTPAERRVPFDSMVASPRYLGVFEDGRHSMFNDRARDATSEAIKASARAITLAFWRAVFERDARAGELLAAPRRVLPALSAPLSVWEARH